MSRGVILMYHRIATPATDPWTLSVSPDHFAEHVEVVARMGRPVTVSQMADSVMEAGEPPARSIAISFDDGYHDNFDEACPVLVRAGVPATFYIATGFIGRKEEFWWDELDRIFLQRTVLPPELRLPWNPEPFDLGAARTPDDFGGNRTWRYEQPAPTLRQALYRQIWQYLQCAREGERADAMMFLREWSGSSETRRGYRPMTIDELVNLSRSPLFEIGGHTVSHPVLSSLTADEQRREIGESRRSLVEWLGAEVASFAYPYGGATPEAIDALISQGVTSACTTRPGAVTRETPVHLLPRVQVKDWSGGELEQRLAQWFER